MSQTLSERHFSRIPFDAETHIINPDDNQSWPCTLFDISLNGALTSLPIYWPAKRGDSYRLEIQLGDVNKNDLRLSMNVKVAHMEVDHAGFEIVDMDVDTASHLHRLIELNTGDETILKRELAELIKLHESEAQ
ncbi:MAG: PilZ domain-containing protein [Gammaproteobacteria bacterium]|nr:PilZ domain-containing protein [Gammaproteobacteria bacterium]